MFATLNTVSEPQNFWKKLKYNLLPPPVTAEHVPTAEGSGFIKLTVPIVRGKIYWNNVRAALGDTAANLVTPVGFHTHTPVNLQTFRSERFDAKLCLNSFLKLLSFLPKKMLMQECAVIDIAGTLAGEIEALPRFCRTLKIITANEKKYAHFLSFCLEEYGSAVYVSDNISRAFDAPVVLFPKRAEIPTAFSRTSVVFAGARENIYTTHLITPEGVTLPDTYARLMPPGINPTAFAAALYEKSGVTSLARCVCPVFRENNRILGYKDALRLVDKF